MFRLSVSLISGECPPVLLGGCVGPRTCLDVSGKGYSLFRGSCYRWLANVLFLAYCLMQKARTDPNLHWWWRKGRYLNTLRTGDADLRFYITTVQDGWRKSAFLRRACFPCTIHLIMQYIEPVSEWSCWRMFIKTWPHSELTFRHRASCI